MYLFLKGAICKHFKRFRAKSRRRCVRLREAQHRSFVSAFEGRRTWSRRDTAKPRDISALLRSSVSAALTTHRVVIHYRAPSS